VVKTSVKLLPETNLISPLDFVKKTVDSCDSLALVISSQNDNLFWVSDFQSEEETDDFAGLASSVDVVAHEEVALVFVKDLFLLFGLVFVGHFFEHVQKFSELTV